MTFRKNEIVIFDSPLHEDWIKHKSLNQEQCIGISVL